jgi:hypothetical protein
MSSTPEVRRPNCALPAVTIDVSERPKFVLDEVRLDGAIVGLME